MPSNNSPPWVALAIPIGFFLLLNTNSSGQVEGQRLAIPAFRIVEQGDDELGWQQGARLTRQGMRESIFSQLGGSEAAFQRSRREKIRREIDRIHSICDLTPEQKEKLETAVEIDIQHLLTKIETILARYDTKMTIQQFQQIQVDVQRLVGAIPSKDAEPEIWRKVLQSQLSERQKEMVVQDSINIQKNQLRTERHKILLSLQRKLALTQRQRAGVIEWLEKQELSGLNFQSVMTRLSQNNEAGFEWTSTQRELLSTPVNRPIITPESIPVDLQPVIIRPGVMMK